MSVPASICELRLITSSGKHATKEERQAARARCKCRRCYDYRRRLRGGGR